MKIILLMLSILLINGCTQPIRPYSHNLISSEHISNKNYIIGERTIAYVGQPIAKVKNYKVQHFESKYMQPSGNFKMHGGIVDISGQQFTDYEVIGETTIENNIFKIVKVQGTDGKYFGVLVNKDGLIYHKVISSVYIYGRLEHVVIIYNFVITPDDIKFINGKEDKIDVSDGYINYELIYSGNNGKSFTLTYREYTSDNIARTAFYQNITYQIGKQQIRFKDTIINVHSVTNERIDFTIISDGF